LPLSICAEGGAKNLLSPRHACARSPYGRVISLAVLDIATLAALTDLASDSAGTVVVITGVFAGCFRAEAVLRLIYA
jgi:hypothetical protein